MIIMSCWRGNGKKWKDINDAQWAEVQEKWWLSLHEPKTHFWTSFGKAPSFDDNDKDKLWTRDTCKRMQTWTEKLDKFVDNSAETVVRNWIC